VVAVDEKTRRVFVPTASANGQGAVSMLAARSGTVLRTIPMTGVPYGVAVDQQTQHVFVADVGDGRLDGTVRMLDARTGAVLRTIPVGGAPLVLTAAGRLGRAFVLGTDGGAQAFLDHLAPGPFPWPDDTLSVLDTRRGTILRTVTVGRDPRCGCGGRQDGPRLRRQPLRQHCERPRRDTLTENGVPQGQKGD
jgi:DNA-binding beta-propeller fold protein YncE